MSIAPLGLLDWISLLGQFMFLSIISVSGAIATVPDMHRYLVDQRGWLSDPQFGSSVAIAQAAPGPNILFVALFGWNVGVNSAGGLAMGPRAWMFGALGVALTMVGILLPSSVVSYWLAGWTQRNHHRRAVRAFRQGMSPVVVGLLIASGWVVMSGGASHLPPLAICATTVATTLIVWRTRMPLLLMLGAGAVMGAFGWL
ncbi:MAG: chromate transporter [Pseudomonadota bacterium]